MRIKTSSEEDWGPMMAGLMLYRRCQPTARHRRTATGLLAAVVVAAGVAGIPVSAAATQVKDNCANGFEDPGAKTLSETKQLPRIQAGLSADPAPYTEEELHALFAVIDSNADGLICLKRVTELQGQSDKSWAFFYLARDNNVAAR